ncbi:hypothetical protein H634G_11669 [Metarhizium anisopliae BRIP 53293]|uniref:Uncharacterized protein n=1 Tax=Metarhizium anisopliae BRIP 53293 TaxID=1291518 RepID=A0A0D9NH00_METAN|nr:hypothetical protein H634G_11669 [Metarhizium anisopliae BRIP 53293]
MTPAAGRPEPTPDVWTWCSIRTEGAYATDQLVRYAPGLHPFQQTSFAHSV